MLIELTKKYKTRTLFLIVVLGLLLRLHGLDSTGFNDDEINKVEAARSYLHGNFLINLEHPMLLKSLITLSLVAADAWNRGLGVFHQIPDEVAVRLPNVIFGSLTCVVIFLFAQEFFSFEVALLSAFLWAVGPIAITVNRLAKEDTLLVFFTWLAYYFYLRAKKVGSTPTRTPAKFYAASGASFGLMLASKYFPHYLGLNFLYYWLVGNKEQFPVRRRIDTLLVFGSCVLMFLFANPVILHPSTLKYMFHYVHQETITHHGYLMMGQLYSESLTFQGGIPIYFYLLFLTIKTPLPVLAAFTVGLLVVWRRRREAGPFFLIFMLLFWIVPFSLSGAKWLRYMLSWMPTVAIIAAIGVVKIAASLSALFKPRMSSRWALGLGTALAVVFLAVPLWIGLRASPFYSLYLNPLGMGRAAYYFPHEELNDAGLREAIQQVCAEAPRGATVGGETPPVFAYYLHQFGRDDLHYFQLSDSRKRAEAPRSAYVVVQDGRKYLENIAFIHELESDDQPIHVVNIGGACAAKIYHAQELAQLRESR
jgi:4-amino-4-deoxy-L-arabinose transferase-like glycosyltransferase